MQDYSFAIETKPIDIKSRMVTKKNKKKACLLGLLNFPMLGETNN